MSWWNFKRNIVEFLKVDFAWYVKLNRHIALG